MSFSSFDHKHLLQHSKGASKKGLPMAYILVLDSTSRAARSSRFTKTVPRSVDPKTGRARICWVFLASPGHRPQLSRVGRVAKPYGEPVATDERRITVEHVRRIEEPLTLAEFNTAMPTQHFNRLMDAIGAQAQALTPGAAEALRSAVVQLYPALRQRLEWLERIASPERFVRGPAGRIWAEERDAMNLALRMGGFPTTSLQEWVPPNDINAPFSAGLISDRNEPGLLELPAAAAERAEPDSSSDEDSLADLFDNEMEANLIDADAHVLPGWRPVRREDTRADIHEFTDDRGRRMEILNVNASPVEKRAGVDLLYFYKKTKSLVGVQYKRLIEGDNITVDERLDDQIERMKAVCKKLNMPPSSPDHWRIGNDWMYIKLARTQTMDPDGSDLIKGLYLPLSYLEVLLTDDRVIGPRGGRRLGYGTVERYITSTLFIDLIKEGWIGSPPTRPKHFMALAQEALSEMRSVVLAMDHSDESPRNRQTRSRARRSTANTRM